MSPTRRSQTLQHKQQDQHPQPQQQQIVLQTPAKKSPNSPVKKTNQGGDSLVSTAASVKESKLIQGNTVNSQSASEIKELRLIPQKSQQNQNQQQQSQSYNLRSTSSTNQSAHSKSQFYQQQQKQVNNSSKENMKSITHSPVRTLIYDNCDNDVKILNAKLGKENGIQSGVFSTPKVKANKTLNLKNTHNQITTNKTPSRKIGFTEDKQYQPSQEMRGFRFETQRINLPRGKVIRCSPQSSANGSKRNSQSPVKLPRNMPPLQDPSYSHNVDYFREYWRMYFQNETLVSDIEQTAHSNYKTLKKIYNLEDYYEHNLIPQLLTYPHKFLHRLRQQQLQKQQQQQKLLIQQRQQQELLLQMKSKSEGNSSNNIDNNARGEGQSSQGVNSCNNENHNGSSSSNNEQSVANNDSSSHGASIQGNGNGNGNLVTQVGIMMGLNKDRMNKRKKHLRRTAAEIEKEYICPYAECGKFYGSEGSLNLHIKIKHNGGNKTERERLAKTLVNAYVNGQISKEIDSLDLNLPPGALQKAVKKAGLLQQVSENEILRQITAHIQQHQVVAQAVIQQANNIM